MGFVETLEAVMPSSAGFLVAGCIRCVVWVSDLLKPRNKLSRTISANIALKSQSLEFWRRFDIFVTQQELERAIERVLARVRHR